MPIVFANKEASPARSKLGAKLNLFDKDSLPALRLMPGEIQFL